MIQKLKRGVARWKDDVSIPFWVIRTPDEVI